MRKRKLNWLKRSLRFILLFLPFISHLLRSFVVWFDNGLQKRCIKLLDKCNLHDYERLNPNEMYEML
uniref:Uncharacterized protein n=1 Tax=Dulem virus 208 TaxID=3145685 RepID=A0AAU8B9J7_9VIRU